jgi:hypothetical protein
MNEKIERATNIYDVLKESFGYKFIYDNRIIPYIYMNLYINIYELREKYQLEYNQIYTEDNNIKINYILSYAYQDILKDSFTVNELYNFKSENYNYNNLNVKDILNNLSKKLSKPIDFPFDQLLFALKLNYNNEKLK